MLTNIYRRLSEVRQLSQGFNDDPKSVLKKVAEGKLSSPQFFVASSSIYRLDENITKRNNEGEIKSYRKIPLPPSSFSHLSLSIPQGEKEIFYVMEKLFPDFLKWWKEKTDERNLLVSYFFPIPHIGGKDGKSIVAPTHFLVMAKGVIFPGSLLYVSNFAFVVGERKNIESFFSPYPSNLLAAQIEAIGKALHQFHEFREKFFPSGNEIYDKFFRSDLELFTHISPSLTYALQNLREERTIRNILSMITMIMAVRRAKSFVESVNPQAKECEELFVNIAKTLQELPMLLAVAEHFIDYILNYDERREEIDEGTRRMANYLLAELEFMENPSVLTGIRALFKLFKH